MKHVCAAALFHVCARAAVYSSLFGSGPPRSCIGKQTAHGAGLGPQGGGGWTRIRPEVAVAAKELATGWEYRVLKPTAVANEYCHNTHLILCLE